MGSLDRICEHSLQPSRKFSVHTSSFAKQAVNHNTESPPEFGDVQLADERAFELLGHRAWQQIHATIMDGRKAVANAGQRKCVVADSAYYVFRLPQFPSGNRGSHMECVQPGIANDIAGRWWRSMLRLIRFAEDKPECGSQGAEFCRGDEGKINLQSAGQKKYAINPSPGFDVKMMQGEMLTIHLRSPIGEDIRQLGCINCTKSEVYVGPPIFA